MPTPMVPQSLLWHSPRDSLDGRRGQRIGEAKHPGPGEDSDEEEVPYTKADDNIAATGADNLPATCIELDSESEGERAPPRRIRIVGDDAVMHRAHACGQHANASAWAESSWRVFDAVDLARELRKTVPTCAAVPQCV